jgi:hypothetical protein
MTFLFQGLSTLTPPAVYGLALMWMATEVHDLWSYEKHVTLIFQHIIPVTLTKWKSLYTFHSLK